MADRPDLVGKVFTHLTVLADDGTRIHRKDGSVGVKWLCQCDCGRMVHVETKELLSGQAKSCGHMAQSNVTEYTKKHMRETPGTDLRRLNDRKPVTNKSGEKNISLTVRSGRTRYRVAVMYKKKQHGGLFDTMEEAIQARDRIRAEYWPNYGTKK